MNASATFYLCPTCFYASDIPNKGHEHKLLCVDPGPPVTKDASLSPMVMVAFYPPRRIGSMKPSF